MPPNRLEAFQKTANKVFMFVGEDTDCTSAYRYCTYSTSFLSDFLLVHTLITTHI